MKNGVTLLIFFCNTLITAFQLKINISLPFENWYTPELAKMKQSLDLLTEFNELFPNEATQKYKNEFRSKYKNELKYSCSNYIKNSINTPRIYWKVIINKSKRSNCNIPHLPEDVNDFFVNISNNLVSDLNKDNNLCNNFIPNNCPPLKFEKVSYNQLEGENI